jgi:hypothetical protein
MATARRERGRPARLAVDLREALGWLAACTLLVVIRARLLDVPLERDEGLFAVLGRAILGGAVPYRDVFEYKPPGVFYLYALAVALSPPTTRGLHVFLLAWCVATALVVALVARAIAGRAAGVWAAVIFAFASAGPSVQGFSGSSEMLLLLPLAASVLLALEACAAPGRRASSAFVLASGAFASVAFWIKQPAALALAVVPVLLVREMGRSSWRAAGRVLAMWAVGGLAVTLAMVPLVVAAGWSEFWYWTFVHSSLYAAVPATGGWARVAGNVSNVATDLGHVIVVGIVGCLVAWRKKRAPVALAFLVLSIMSAFHSQFLYRHYFALLVPGVSVIGGAGLAWLGEAWLGGRSVPAKAVASAAAVAFVLGIPLVARPAYWLRPEPVTIIREALGAQGFEAAPLLAQYVREHTRPDEPIFIYGSEPQIAFLSERRDVNPFVMMYPMTWPWPRHREFQERLWAAIAHDPPQYILVPRAPSTLVKSPQMDPFLEAKLNELASREYEFDAVLLRDRDGGFHLEQRAPDPRAEPSHEVFCELWRRRTTPSR